MIKNLQKGVKNTKICSDSASFQRFFTQALINKKLPLPFWWKMRVQCRYEPLLKPLLLR